MRAGKLQTPWNTLAAKRTVGGIFLSVTPRITVLILLFIAAEFPAFAQDPQFSQFFSAPLYLNPAFTGATREHRFIANYRNQWQNVSNGYVTYAFSYDYNMKSTNSGFGIMATSDRAGAANLSTTNIGMLYSYKLRLSDGWVLTPGLHFAYGNRGLNRNKIVLMDQLTYGDVTVPTNDPLITAIGNTHYFDFGSGMLVYNKTFWMGASAYHMNRPNLSMIADDSRLPMKVSVHGGARLRLYHGPFKRDIAPSIAPSFIYKKQGNMDQLDLGMNFHYNPVMVGVWYRGIPVSKNQYTHKVNQDALAFLLGMKYEQFEFGYSYDFTISSLGPYSGGAHEVAIVYELAYPGKRKPRKRDTYIPCPTFLLSN